MEFRLSNMSHGHAVFRFTVLQMPCRLYVVKIKSAGRIQVCAHARTHTHYNCGCGWGGGDFILVDGFALSVRA